MIESTALRYFREVTERGSIKRAAESLRIAPSAISRQVQGLEDELSVKLFERGARGMSLTNAGQLLYRYAQESQVKLDRVRAQVEEFDSLQRGHVKLATVEGLLASFLSDFVVDLSADYPGISITVTTVGSRGVAEMVGRHEADLGLVFGRAPRHDLIELARMRQSLCLMVSPQHAMAGKKYCTIKELAGLRVILPDPSFGIRQEIDRACAKAISNSTLMAKRTPSPFCERLPPRPGWELFCRETQRCRNYSRERLSQYRCATSGWKRRR